MAVSLGVLVLAPSVASAQMPPSPGGQPGTLEEEPKPEGVAEQAPREPGQLPTVPVLPPWPGEKKKAFQLFELDGYYRLRQYWLSNLTLGAHDGGSGTPFRESLSCLDAAPDNLGACSDKLWSWDMRLRLEPTIHLSETVAAKFQLDVLDNVVLGSTPDGVFYDGTASPGYSPVSAFSEGQVPNGQGRNWAWDSIRAKRAWAEVGTPLGMLRFGRMPKHWGLGILENSGADDPYHDDYCLDCDFGDTGDRIMFSGEIPGTGLGFAVGREWLATGPTTAQVGEGQERYLGPAFDLDDADDLTQWVFVISDLDSPEKWREKVEAGGLALNYGAYVLKRDQGYDVPNVDLTVDAADPTGAASKLVRREATMWIPDVYFRLAYKSFTLEGEGVMVIGSIDELSDAVAGLGPQDILSGGGVLRGQFRLLGGDLVLGLEGGFATGDQWEGLQGRTSVQEDSFLPDPTINATVGDDTLSAFRFDFDYITDLILFRRILGAVSNAAYAKPVVSYDITERIRFRAQPVVSFALEPIATPGNSSFYGVELDGDLGYHNDDEGFYFGISYGVFFPGGALDRPVALFPIPGEAGEAETAQTFQSRLVLKF